MQANILDEVDELPDVLFEHEIEVLPEVVAVPTVDFTVPAELVCPRSPPVREIIIPRSDILKSMISEFSATDVLQCCLIFAIKGDNGKVEIGRGAGGTREALSLFWREFSVAVATGASEKVPTIRHDFQKLEWQSVARILAFGFNKANYFPLFILKAFIGSCLFGEDAITKECLLESFELYVLKDEQDTMKKCMKGELDPKNEEMMDLLSSYKCHRLPTKENIQVIIEELAHPEFHDFHSMSVMYAARVPSSKRVIKLLSAEPCSENERVCFDHLKRYIKSLNENTLAAFLQFVTGSDIVTVEKIEVSFNTTSGTAREIVARTCAPVLELPSTYQSYSELSEEMSNTLSNSFAWSLVII